MDAVKCATQYDRYAMIRADDEPRILPAITTLKGQLVDFTEPDFGLLEELLRLEALTPRQVADVLSERSMYRKNEALLDHLKSEDQCSKLLKALKRTAQQHVVNYITQNGGQKRCDTALISQTLHLWTNLQFTIF